MMSKYSEMTDEQYFAAQNEFMEKYKAPACKPIEVLDLIMRREFAEAIAIVLITISIALLTKRWISG